MQEEKFNNEWRHKLEDAGNLPHALLQNKDAAWEKLQSRLDKKPHRKVFTWYWLAAACLLSAILIPVFMTSKHTDIVLQPRTEPSAKENIAKQKETPLKPVATAVVTTSQQPKTVASEKKSELGKITIDDSASVTPVVNNNEQPIQNTIVVVPAPIDTNTIAAIKTTKQKKLKVVHINELGEPVEVPVDFARGYDLHLFQLKLAQQEIYKSSSVATNEPSIISITIKHSSN